MTKKFNFARRQSRRDYLLANSPDPWLRRIYRIRRYTGWLLVIVSALFILLNLQLFTLTSLRNIRSSLQAASRVSAGDTTVISYPSGTHKCMLPFGSGLAICSDKTLYFELPSNYSQMEMTLSYANPAMRASNQYLLVFDRGGYRFTVTNTLSELYSQTMQSPVTNADISANGSVAIVTDEAGYKSAVTVYNIDNEQLYKWSSPDYYIMSAVLSPDGKRLALFCFRQEGLTLVSRLFFTDIDSTETPSESETITNVDMNGSLVLGMKYLGNNTVCVVCDNATYVVSRGGQIRYRTDYSADSLLSFDLTDDCVALATESYSQSSRADIVLINARGSASRKPLSLSSEPDSISYCDGRLAVLTGDTVTFYSKSLRQIDQQTNLAGVSRVYMRSGGTAIALFGSQARVLTIGNPLNDLNSSGG
ncbi:MAG TPA: hypothetical protein IAA32_09180 [Candidatus Butyricicoccus stercorigallinarum]|nr:hypothetical protein [Candidatus Butyricicoccus stercorigallinarum]